MKCVVLIRGKLQYGSWCNPSPVLLSYQSGKTSQKSPHKNKTKSEDALCGGKIV